MVKILDLILRILRKKINDPKNIRDNLVLEVRVIDSIREMTAKKNPLDYKD